MKLLSRWVVILFIVQEFNNWIKAIYKLEGEGPVLTWYQVFCKVRLTLSSQLEFFTYKQIKDSWYFLHLNCKDLDYLSSEFNSTVSLNWSISLNTSHYITWLFRIGGGFWFGWFWVCFGWVLLCFSLAFYLFWFLFGFWFWGFWGVFCCFLGELLDLLVVVLWVFFMGFLVVVGWFGLFLMKHALLTCQ